MMTIDSGTATETTAARSTLLDAESWLTYGFTGRVAGMGVADGNVSYSGGRDQADAWEMRQRWLSASRLDPAAIVTTGQVHGTTILTVGADDAGRGARPGSAVLGLADATMTRAPGPVLFSLHADCLPILFADPVRRVVAVTHAGWRGTVADIAGRTVAAMGAEYGSAPGDVRAYLGPSISGAAYEVGPEVIAAWHTLQGNTTDACWPGDGDRWQFDAAQANRERLLLAGLRDAHIESSGICTLRHQDDWFSHRAQGPATGRFGAFIAIQPG